MLTPNIPEAEVLTGVKIKNREDMILSAKKLINMGVKNVLIKGGHLKKKVEDIFLNKSDFKIFTSPRYKTKIHMVLGAHCQVRLQLFFMWKNY